MSTSIEEEIRAAASMASLALAILVFFTNLRREALDADLGQVAAFGWRTIVEALPDVALVLLTAVAVVAMAPLAYDAFEPGEVGTREGVLPTLFALIWLGFAFVLVVQLWLLGRRLAAAAGARWG